MEGRLCWTVEGRLCLDSGGKIVLDIGLDNIKEGRFYSDIRRTGPGPQIEPCLSSDTERTRPRERAWAGVTQAKL